MRISAVDDDFDYDSDVYEERDHSEDDDEVFTERTGRSAIESNTIAVRPNRRAQFIRVRKADSTTVPSPQSSPVYDVDDDEFQQENVAVNNIEEEEEQEEFEHQENVAVNNDEEEEEFEQFGQEVPPPDYY